MELGIILLGIIQGLSEWLPISSTGHLRLAEFFLGLDLPLIFDVFLHVGTLIVTVLFFKKDLRRILIALIKLDFKSREGMLIPRIIVGSIPTAIIGFVVARLLEDGLHEIMPLPLAFIISGLFVYFSKMGKCMKDQVDYKSAIIIGIAQGLSTIPGLSRSGLTIATALMLGIKREEAFRFSFILSIPAIVGALILTLLTQFDALVAVEAGLLDLSVGALTATLVGYASLKFLRRFLHKFHIFSFYSISLGLLLTLMAFH